MTLLLPTAINFVPFYLEVTVLFQLEEHVLAVLVAQFGNRVRHLHDAAVHHINRPRRVDRLRATIDGASQLQIVTRIVMPIMAGGMAALGILTFVAVYNEFILASLIIDQPDLRTRVLFFPALRPRLPVPQCTTCSSPWQCHGHHPAAHHLLRLPTQAGRRHHEWRD